MPEIAPPTVTLESARRLSRSFLWRIQRTYYETRRIDAWRHGAVPSYVTTNPFTARAYAKVVLGFLRDCQSAGNVDPSQPFYIVEAGSGSGRFGYHFLKSFQEMHGQSSVNGVRVKFVMTDFHGGGLQYWREHSRLSPLFESGILDIARFDVERDSQIKLSYGGETLSAATLRNPLVVFANYVFDSIPQDLFFIGEDGGLHECTLSIVSPQEEPDLNDFAILRRAIMSFDRREVSAPYYSDPSWNRILDRYRATLAPTSLIFPTGALSAIARLRDLSRGRLLLLSCDKGDHHEPDLANRPEPGLAVHDGCFSIHVNYHAIGLHFIHLGGVAMHTSHRHRAIDVSAFVLLPGAELGETLLAYRDAVDGFGPDDFFIAKMDLEAAAEKMTLQQFLVLLRLSNYDSRVITSSLPALMPLAVAAPAALKQDLRLAVDRVWETYFPISDQPDVPFSLGLVMTGIEQCHAALIYFQHSLDLYGPAAATVYHMGICYFAIGKVAEATRHIDWALDLDPSLESAKNFRGVIEASLTGS